MVPELTETISCDTISEQIAERHDGGCFDPAGHQRQHIAAARVTLV
jgi:hypothetical protein